MVRHPGEETVEERHFHALAAPAALALVQRREDAVHRSGPGDQVHERDTHADGRPPLLTRDAHEAAFGLEQEVHARPIPRWAVRAEGVDGAVDESGVPLEQERVGVSHAVQAAGPEVLDEHIGSLHQAPHAGSLRRVDQVEGDAALVAIDAHEVAALAADHRRPAPGVVAVTGALELDDVSAQVPEGHPGERTGQVPAEVQDADACQWPGSGGSSPARVDPPGPLAYDAQALASHAGRLAAPVDARNPNTLALASFVAGTRPEDLPPQVAHAVRRAVLDATGCALGGISTPLYAAAVRALRDQGVRGVVPVIGGGFAAPPAFAALVDGISINALDYDDTYEDGANPISHPGSSTVGALLAMLPRRPDLTLGELFTAAAVGYEATIRVARAVQPSQERRDFVWGLGPHQVFGSASVAGRLLGLDLDGTLESLGLAGVHTSVPSVWTASGWLKDAVGWPTMTGVLAAYMAAGKFAGPRRILDGRRSYYATVASDRYRPEELTGELGERWHLLDLSLKPYPACRWIHPVLDALEAMVASDGIDARAVERVEVHGFWELEKLFLRYRPADLIDAQFSLPYTCAQVLSRTPPGPAWFSEERLGAEEVARLGALVSVTTDPGVEEDRRTDPSALRARVIVHLRDGRVLSDERSVAHGHPRDPMTDAEVVAKFMSLAEPRLGAERAEAFARGVLDLPDGTPAAELFDAVL